MDNKKNRIIAAVESFLIQTAGGFCAAMLFALVTIPEQRLEMSIFLIGILSIPIVLGLGAIACALYAVYIIIRIIEAIATKLDIFDIDHFS